MYTPGPWTVFYKPKYDEWHVSLPMSSGSMKLALAPDGIQSENREADAYLIAAAPTLVDALKGLIGLCQLVRNRGDLPTSARQALTHNHRIIAAYEALSAAGVEGFQPSDFDAHKGAA